MGMFTLYLFSCISSLCSKLSFSCLLYTSCLNGSDDYEVYLLKEEETRCISDEVCFDELGEIIDRHVESGTDKEEYARFCEQIVSFY